MSDQLPLSSKNVAEIDPDKPLRETLAEIKAMLFEIKEKLDIIR